MNILMMYLYCLSTVTMVAATGQITVTHAQKQMVGIRIAYKGSIGKRYADIIASDLEVSNQFFVATCEYTTLPVKKREITDLVYTGVFFLLILELHDQNLEYRLYDATTGQMIPKSSGYCITHDTKQLSNAHHIADKIWCLLTGQKSMFNSSLAYAKEIPYKKNITITHICVAQHDGSEEYVIVSQPTISVAPRWGGTIDAPLLFYSEYTNTNVRLMVTDMHKKRKIVTRYDGVAMHVTSNHDGSIIAFSASRGNGMSHIYMHGKGTLEQCTVDDGANACPVFNHDDSTIYYCSDAKTGIPHIMSYICATKKCLALPISGYCITPAYNNTRKLLAYSKMIDGTLQICVYDPQTCKERQITHDSGSHEDPTWSPCGNFSIHT